MNVHHPSVAKTQPPTLQRTLIFGIVRRYQRGATRKAEMTPLSQVVAEEAEAAAAEGDPMGLISRRWLALADTMHTPPPIDNRDFICQHGRCVHPPLQSRACPLCA